MDSTVDRILSRATHALHHSAANPYGAEVQAGSSTIRADQHLVHNVRVITDNSVAVVVPPLFHQIMTANLKIENTPHALRHAQDRLEHTLRRLDSEYTPTPDGLCITVAWGLPYFRTYVSGPSVHYLPVDNRASAAAGHPVLAILDAERFPSDPEDVILEENDITILLRSDVVDHIAAGMDALFESDLDFWEITSVRKGFIGGGYDGGPGLPKQMALEAGIPGADLIPESAQMFLGFTSSQKAALGSDLIANLESIPGLTDQWPNGYFRNGTTMHLSHLFEDVEAWYRSHSYQERVQRAFRPGLQGVKEGTQTVPEGPAQTETEAEVAGELRDQRIVGHSAALQPATRLPADVIDNYGNFYPQGTAVPLRGDFNTLDNPFSWTATPGRDSWSEKPAAGLHFLAFAPTTDAFHRARRAMDGHYVDGSALPLDPRSPHHGMNSVLHTTHRQNFLVPGRAHRSFPLVEFL